jgi:hypothetical protein
MKTFITFILFLVSYCLMAQTPIEVRVESRPSSQGIQPAFEVVVPQATPKDAIDMWKKTITPQQLFKKGEPKMEKLKDEWIARDVVIVEITTMPLNVYTQISSFPGNIYIRIFLQSAGKFIGPPDSTSTAEESASRFIKRFAVQLYVDAVEKELKDEENKLQAAQNDLHRLQKSKKNYEGKVEEAKSDEKVLRMESKENDMLLSNNQEVVQLDSLDVTAREKAQKEIEKQIKDNEKDIRKAQKSQTSFERKISNNIQEQNDKAAEIEKQKLRIRDLKIKLENIRATKID